MRKKTIKEFSPPIDYIISTDDAHVAEGYPNMNWGDATALYLQSYTENYKNERIFLKFDLSGTPANSKIVKVDLYLHRWRGKFADVDVRCYSIDDSWGEGTLTWNNQPTIKDMLGEVRLKRGGPEWYSWDVTSFVLSELERDKVASFCLKALTEDESGQHAFSSREWRGGTLSPYLKVIYYPA